MKTKEHYIEEFINYLYGDIPEEDKPLYQPEITQSIADFKSGFNLAEKLFKPKWISVSEQTPPSNIELLVKSPDGIVHLANWRESYNIFTCQNKDESSYDWQYTKIPQ